MAAFAELSPCPCGLPYEDVRDHCLGEGMICKAFRRGSRTEICGELLADHPHRFPAGKCFKIYYSYC